MTFFSALIILLGKILNNREHTCTLEEFRGLKNTWVWGTGFVNCFHTLIFIYGATLVEFSVAMSLYVSGGNKKLLFLFFYSEGLLNPRLRICFLLSNIFLRVVI